MAYAKEGPGVTSPLMIAEKMKPLLSLKRTDFSLCGACRNCNHFFLFFISWLRFSSEFLNTIQDFTVRTFGTHNPTKLIQHYEIS